MSLNDPPHGTEQGYYALRLAKGLLKNKDDVNLTLRCYFKK